MWKRQLPFKDKPRNDDDDDVVCADGVFCLRETDTVSCWPTTGAGDTAIVSCPHEIGGVQIDTTREQFVP